MHILKNIRNNLVTEKTKTFSFADRYTAKIVEAQKKDCIEIHNKESDTFIKKIKLSCFFLYLANFEKKSA